MELKKEKSCGCVVFNDEKQVLVIKSVLGHYELPKGHMEDGESEEETAIREVKEETNIDVEIISNLRYKIRYQPKPNISKDVVYFLAKPKTTYIKRQEKEVLEVYFVSVEKALSLLTFSNTRQVLNYFLPYLNKLS